jgi:hopanoid biosynthesis associated protein HpnK
VRRLIINADDFGLTPGVNRAIAEAHSQGIVTSATLMASAGAFDDAVKLTRALPQLSVGCHVILVDGTPILEASKASSLIAGNSSAGTQFRTSLSSFAGCALSGRLKDAEIEAEATAQIRKLQAQGIEVSHVDTHKHAHIFPVVYRPLLRAARSCGVRAVRNPFVPRTYLGWSVLRQRPGLWVRYLQVRGLQSLRKGFLRAVAKAGMVTTDGSLGIVATGSLDFEVFQTIMARLPAGNWEFVSHPGYSDSDLDRVKTRLRESRGEELKLLTSPEARDAIAKAGIQLCSYAELVGDLALRETV